MLFSNHLENVEGATKSPFQKLVFTHTQHREFRVGLLNIRRFKLLHVFLYCIPMPNHRYEKGKIGLVGDLVGARHAVPLRAHIEGMG